VGRGVERGFYSELRKAGGGAGTLYGKRAPAAVGTFDYRQRPGERYCNRGKLKICGW